LVDSKNYVQTTSLGWRFLNDVTPLFLNE